VDEISVHLISIVPGAGTSLFVDLTERLDLQPLEVVGTRSATHFRYRVVK
jgi:hypothetical protein